MLDFASLDCTAWIQSRLQAMAWGDLTGLARAADCMISIES
jgi:hypothetical protein